MKKTQFIIEGLDRLGKSSLISNIQNAFGFHFTIHYSKPLELKTYNYSKYQYQYVSFNNGFKLLNTEIPVIFDRFHLGEEVYAPLYRNYPGDYVFELEQNHNAQNMINARLILLTTSNFSMLKDDGQSFDFNRKEEEQYKFVEAFNKSIMPDKRIIDIHNGIGGYKDYQQIFAEAIY